MASCGCPAPALDEDERYDPTGTGSIRRRYERALASRFERFATLIRLAILADDALGLLPDLPSRRELRRAARSGDQEEDEPPDPLALPGQERSNFLGATTLLFSRFRRAGRRRFAGFTLRENRINAFMAWLNEQADAGILQIRVGIPIAASANQHWSNIYIDSAYRKGINDAAIRSGLGSARQGELRASFSQPIHAERVGRLYLRNLEHLKGITAEMSRQIREILALGMAEGRHPSWMARRIAERVEKIGITRARTLARTEVISAHAEATLATYREAGAVGVENLAEFRTAGDLRVCPICAELNGRVYDLGSAEGVIPVHPNCRCAWLPVFEDESEEA